MRIVLSLVKRNLRIYRRDRAGVLLSLLAALMLLLIYALFLGAIQADSLKAKLPSAASRTWATSSPRGCSGASS